MKETKLRKKPVRRCFSRLQWLDIGVGRFRFEMTKQGVSVHRKGARRIGDSLVPFEALTDGGGFEWADGATKVRFRVTASGVEVRRGGSKLVFLVGFAELANLARPQPLLPL